MYNNRRTLYTTGCCVPKVEEQKTDTKPDGKDEKPIVKNGCRIETIVAISRVNDKIMVMYDDCTYTVADPKVLDEDICSADKQLKMNLEPLVNLKGDKKAQVVSLD